MSRITTVFGNLLQQKQKSTDSFHHCRRPEARDDGAADA